MRKRRDCNVVKRSWTAAFSWGKAPLAERPPTDPHVSTAWIFSIRSEEVFSHWFRTSSAASSTSWSIFQIQAWISINLQETQPIIAELVDLLKMKSKMKIKPLASTTYYKRKHKEKHGLINCVKLWADQRIKILSLVPAASRGCTTDSLPFLWKFCSPILGSMLGN